MLEDHKDQQISIWIEPESGRLLCSSFQGIDFIGVFTGFDLVYPKPKQSTSG